MKRILVVDDEPATLTLATEYLRLSGFEVAQCENAEETLKLLAQGGAFDLIVVDKRMPGMDGLELCRLLHKDPATADMPIIMLSASISASTSAKEIGAAAFIPKPFHPKDLVAEVKRLLP